MDLRRLTVTGIFLYGAVAALAQTGSVHGVRRVPPPDTAALKAEPSVEATIAVQRVLVDSPENSVVKIRIDLLNRSPKSITAYFYRVRAQYADGKQVTTEGGYDMIKLIAVPLRKDDGFRPGQIRTEVATMNVRDGFAPIHAEVYPAAVIFEDRTALGDKRRVANTLAFRSSEAEEMADLIADLEQARASDNPSADLGARIKRLRDGKPLSGPFQKRAKDLEALAPLFRLADKRPLEIQLQVFKAQQRLLAEHSELRGAE